MKYYLDADLSPKIAAIIRKAGGDAVSSIDEGFASLDDELHLERSAGLVRCLVTRNRDDFINLTVQFFRDDRPHAGVLIVPHSYPPDRFTWIASALMNYSSAHPDGMSPYTVDFLPAPAVSTKRRK
jgi:hypothetical protein